MPISYNAQTGEAFTLDGETWKPAQVSKVPQTGEVFVLDGAEWRPMPKDLPKPAPERGILGGINNIVGGVADAAADAVTLGYADELGAGIRSGARYLTDKVGLTKAPQRTIKDLVTQSATGAPEPQSNYERALGDIRGREKQFSEEHPYLSTGAGILGGLVTGAPIARAVGLATTTTLPRAIAKSGAIGAGYGGVSGFGHGEGGFEKRLESAKEGALFGGALGAAVPAIGSTIGRLITPVQNRLTPEQQRLIGVARTEGIPLTAAQEMGSRPLQTLESTFGTLPLTAGPQQDIWQRGRAGFNRAALRHIGETGDSLSPDVLRRARDRLGADYTRLSAQTTVVPDQQFVQELGDTVANYAQRLDVMRRPVFEAFAKQIDNAMAAGGMPGAIYQRTRSMLSKMAKSYSNSDPFYAEALRELRNALDSAASRSMPSHLQGDWARTNLQYGNLRTLEKAMSNTTTGAAAGNLQPTQLALAVKGQHPNGYAYGAGPMNDLSRVGDSFIRDQIPNSGTPERTWMTNLLTGASATGGGAALAMGDPVAAAVTAAAPLVLPRVAQWAYNTRPAQAYFRNRLVPNIPALNEGLLTGALSSLSAGYP
jgi:hypothetical protein